MHEFHIDINNQIHFFYIGNKKTIINEKKKGKVQVVHDDEQEEIIEQTA